MRAVIEMSDVVVYEIILERCKFDAGIAQLGEQQTEVLEVPCSIHGPGKAFLPSSTNAFNLIRRDPSVVI